MGVWGSRFRGIQSVVYGLCRANIAGRVGLAYFYHISAIHTAIGHGSGVGFTPSAEVACLIFNPVFHLGTGFGVVGSGEGTIVGKGITIKARAAVAAIRS